jgi:hypothetical protein
MTFEQGPLNDIFVYFTEVKSWYYYCRFASKILIKFDPGKAPVYLKQSISSMGYDSYNIYFIKSNENNIKLNLNDYKVYNHEELTLIDNYPDWVEELENGKNA